MSDGRIDNPWKSDMPILALVYEDSVLADACLRGIATALKRAGWRLSGFVQHNEQRPQRRKCDMVLEDLAHGTLIRISEDRGALSRGCVLVVDELLRATEAVRASLDADPDVLILNKFGKTEAETGGGVRTLISDAIERGVPLIVAVPARNLDAWRAFVADLSHDLVVTDQARTTEEALMRVTGKVASAIDFPEPVALADCCTHGC